MVEELKTQQSLFIGSIKYTQDMAIVFRGFELPLLWVIFRGTEC